MITSTLKLVVHIQRTHHAHVHIDELGGEIQVALKVRGVDDVNHHIGHLLAEVLAHIEFLGGIARHGIGARKVGEQELIAKHRGTGLTGIDGDARIVAHMGMRTRGIVEKRGLATVGVAHQGHMNGAALAHCLTLKTNGRIVLHAFVIGNRLGLHIAERRLLQTALVDHFNLFCLLMAQRHLVAHHLIFHRILQRGIHQHLHRFSLHKAHLDDALAETTVAQHFDDDTFFACFQFR